MSSGWAAALQTAFGALVGSAIAGIVALVVANRQRREQRLNEWILRRNKWADELREQILEVISPATWFHLVTWKNRSWAQEDGTSWNAEQETYTLKLTGSIERICLMLDPKKDAHNELKGALEAVRSVAFMPNTKDVAQFENAIQSLRNNVHAVVSQVAFETASFLREGHLPPPKG